MLDALPLLSEPMSRAFTGERPVPSVFFFLKLFAHIGIPLGNGGGVLAARQAPRAARPAAARGRSRGRRSACLTWRSRS